MLGTGVKLSPESLTKSLDFCDDHRIATLPMHSGFWGGLNPVERRTMHCFPQPPINNDTCFAHSHLQCDSWLASQICYPFVICDIKASTCPAPIANRRVAVSTGGGEHKYLSTFE